MSGARIYHICRPHQLLAHPVDHGRANIIVTPSQAGVRRAASFAVIARREGKVERHIRLLAPLAFVSPRIVSALLDGTAPADLTLTKLARALPYCWAEQERRVGTSAPFHG